MKSEILLIAFFFTFNVLHAQTAKVWDYPVKPGTEEWIALSTHDEMLEVCQIPSEILNTVTTEDLIEICLNYPMYFDFYAYDNLQEGIRRVTTDFNGLQELFKRKDNAQQLINLLKYNDLGTIYDKKLPNSEFGKWIVRQTLIEAFLSQESILVNANLEQQKEIASIAMKNMILKEKQPQLYSQYSLGASAYLLGVNYKMVNKGISLSPNMEQFLKEGSLRDKSIIDDLVKNYSFILIK